MSSAANGFTVKTPSRRKLAVNWRRRLAVNIATRIQRTHKTVSTLPVLLHCLTMMSNVVPFMYHTVQCWRKWLPSFWANDKNAARQKFASDAEMKSADQPWLGQQPASFLASGFQKRFDRCDKFSNKFGWYVGQEGWLSPTERVSVSAISLRHILASPTWVRPSDNRGKCQMDGKRIQCLSNALQHVPIYLPPFPSNSTHKFKRSPFYNILLDGYVPGTIEVNVTWMQKGFNAIQYPSIFNRLRAIARYWSEIATFSYPLHLMLGCSHWNSGKKFGPQKTRIMWLPGSEDSLTIG